MFVKGATTQNNQSGYASLAVVLLLLIAITVITFYGAQVAVQKQRMLGNDVRNIFAFTHAEQALDAGVMYLGRNMENLLSYAVNGRWKLCSDSETGLPCGDGTANVFGSSFIHYHDISTAHIAALANEHAKVYLVAACRKSDNGVGCDDMNSTLGGTQAAPDPRRSFHIIATGNSRDGNGRANTRQSVRRYPLMQTQPAAALIVGGEADIQGKVELVANPNGGGRGVPVSAWSSQTLGSGTAAIHSCEIDEFELNDGSCPNGAAALTNPGHKGIDIIDDAADFPPDLFEYLFGVPTSAYHQFREYAAAAGQAIENCRRLDTDASGLYWIDGDCEIRSSVGSPTAPVLLIAANGSLRVEGAAEVYGLLFAFAAPDTNRPEPVTINGTAYIRGGIATDRTSTRINGSPIVVHDTALLNELIEGVFGFGPVPGSWFDNHR